MTDELLKQADDVLAKRQYYVKGRGTDPLEKELCDVLQALSTKVREQEERDEHVIECVCCSLKMIVNKKEDGESLDCIQCKPHGKQKCTHEGRYFFTHPTQE